MAKATQTLQFMCRSCRQSITRPSLQIRQFGTNTPKFNSIPNFSQTTSPELDALLLDWRRQVFTPAALRETHRALVYKKSRHSLIENDPGVTVTMSDGEEVKLEPLNAFDKPNTTYSLHKIANILSNTEDPNAWAQLPPFLEGMQIAKINLPPWFVQKITRKANELGRASVIKKCALMVKKTGLKLSNKPVTRELFIGCHNRLADIRFKGEELDQAYTFAEGLAFMLESKEHCGWMTEESVNGHTDMRRDLTVAGVLLEFAAAKAMHVYKGRDIEGSVGSFCQKIVALAGNDILREGEKVKLGEAIEDWLPIANGIKMALRVTGLDVGQSKTAATDLKTKLKVFQGQLDAAIQKAAEQLKAESGGKPRRGLQMLEKVQKAS